ncbi:MAG: BLUF domain-containing protein [SAR324 cluster bacterium]|nr:BLUF domain-containing protein [SAR324 cluster bacterium]
MNEYRLVYVSKRQEKLATADIKSIIQTAEEKNKSDHISGILLYSNRSFLQVLEGDLIKINQTFKRICQDPRHSEILLLSLNPIEHRFFSDWFMLLFNVDTIQNLDAALFDSSEKSLYHPFPLSGELAIEIGLLAKYYAKK